MLHAVAAVVSALHLLALAIGLPAIVLRALALSGPRDPGMAPRVLVADSAWGVAALLWLTTGPARAFGPLEKGSAFYLSSWLFYIKMGLFLLVFALEIRPMLAFMRWRGALRKKEAIDLSLAPSYARTSWIQAGLVLVIVFVASFMARGFGLRH